MFQESYIRRIYAVVGIAAILAFVAYAYSALTEAKYLSSGPTTISVEGVGEVFATPDIATFTFRVEAKEDEATSAQNRAAEIMGEIEAYLAEVGVEEKDIKTTSFNMSPRYEYPERNCEWGYCPPSGEPTIIGYAVDQMVQVKVRDTDKAGEIISNVGDKGALNVSGLSFSVDDEDTLMADARKKAIEDAREKAGILAQNLDARIVRMTGYWEERGGHSLSYRGGLEMAFDMEESMSVKSASLPMGENTVTVRVNISYEIR